MIYENPINTKTLIVKFNDFSKNSYFVKLMIRTFVKIRIS